MSSISNSISPGAEHILRNKIGLFISEDISKTIHKYSMPQSWGDLGGWLRYIAANIDYKAQQVLQRITSGRFVPESDWAKLEEQATDNFVLAMILDREIFPFLESSEQISSKVKGHYDIGHYIREYVLTNKIKSHVTRILTDCCTAHARGLDQAGADSLPHHQLSLDRFIERVKGDMVLMNAFNSNVHSVKHIRFKL